MHAQIVPEETQVNELRLGLLSRFQSGLDQPATLASGAFRVKTSRPRASRLHFETRSHAEARFSMLQHHEFFNNFVENHVGNSLSTHPNPRPSCSLALFALSWCKNLRREAKNFWNQTCSRSSHNEVPDAPDRVASCCMFLFRVGNFPALIPLRVRPHQRNGNRLLFLLYVVPLSERLPARRDNLDQKLSLRDARRARHTLFIR